jgi:peptide/nickel transport system ATP-binding protein
MSETPVLVVDQLSTAFAVEQGLVTVLDRVSFELGAGEFLGVVGESGCGKSVTALSIMGLLPKPSGRVTGGQIRLGEQDLLALKPAKMRGIRGKRISMIFQEPMTALNPVQTIGKQLAEAYTLHQPHLSRTDSARSSLEMLERVGIPAPDQRLAEYPHQLSGGMRQRIMIAMALAGNPEVLIADEPTTALDVTIQAQILELLRELQREHGMSVIFITHDLGVIAELCSRVVVMYAGRVVERADIVPLFEQPLHPYTKGLLDSIPRLDDQPKTTLTTIPGMVPGLGELPAGCRFANRCGFVIAQCENEAPALAGAESGRQVACHRWAELKGEAAGVRK